MFLLWVWSIGLKQVPTEQIPVICTGHCAHFWDTWLRPTSEMSELFKLSAPLPSNVNVSKHLCSRTFLSNSQGAHASMQSLRKAMMQAFSNFLIKLFGCSVLRPSCNKSPVMISVGGEESVRCTGGCHLGICVCSHRHCTAGTSNNKGMFHITYEPSTQHKHTQRPVETWTNMC